MFVIFSNSVLLHLNTLDVLSLKLSDNGADVILGRLQNGHEGPVPCRTIRPQRAHCGNMSMAASLAKRFYSHMKFGNPAAAMARYASGSFAHSSPKDRPSLPVIGKYGRKLTSNPVAQIITSTEYSTPSSVSIPFLVNSLIADSGSVTLDSCMASRNPSAGPRRRHPMGNVGTSLFTNLESFFRIVFIRSLVAFRPIFCHSCVAILCLKLPLI